MSTRAPQPSPGESLELSVEELLRRARPLPSHDEMATVSHELRSPLTSVKGYTSLTEEEGEAFLAALEA